MAITIPNATVEDFSTPTATSHTQNLPTFIADDVIYVVIAANPDGTGTVPAVNIPSGWTEIGSQTAHGAASDGLLAVIRRVMQGGDGSTVTITTTQTCMMATIATGYRGVDTTTPEDAAAPTFTTGSSPPSSPSITTVTDNARVCYAALVDGAPTWGDGDIPSGTTLRGTMVNNPPSNGQNLGSADENQATLGASGTAAWTNGGSEEYVACTYAIRPAPEGGNYDQTSFRAVNDDGSESASTFKAAVNTDWNQVWDENFRIRFLIQEDDDVEDLNMEFQIQYNLNAAGWNDVTAASSVVRMSASTHFASGDTTTQRVGAGTFVGTNNGMDETDGIAGGAGMDFTTTVNQESEVEYCCQIRSADTTRGDTIELRLWNDTADAALDTYTNTPEMTIPVGAGMTLASAERKIAAAAAENPGTFDFDRSLPWGGITLALREAATGGSSNLSPTTKFTKILTTGTVTVRDGAGIDGLEINADVVMDDALDLTDVTINGDLTIGTGVNDTLAFSNVTVTGDVTNSSAGNTLTINASDGSDLSTSEPGTGNGEVNIVNAVTITIHVTDTPGTNIENARVYLVANETVGSITSGDVILTGLTNASGILETTTFNYESAFNPSGLDCLLTVRQGSVSPYKKPFEEGAATVTSIGYNTTVALVSDE